MSRVARESTHYFNSGPDKCLTNTKWSFGPQRPRHPKRSRLCHISLIAREYRDSSDVASYVKTCEELEDVESLRSINDRAGIRMCRGLIPSNAIHSRFFLPHCGPDCRVRHVFSTPPRDGAQMCRPLTESSPASTEGSSLKRGN